MRYTIDGDILTGIADAIRTKTGSEAGIAPVDMADEIDDISVGTGTVETTDLANVTLIDHDGTVLHTYTAEEFLALEALPDNPDHLDEGLTARGWNWSLSDAKAYVTNHGYLVIGQMYAPTDGKTKLVIEVFDTSVATAFSIQQSASNGVTVDYGDGSTETKEGTNGKIFSHTYAEAGTYTVKFTVNSGTMSFGGTSNGYTSLRRDGESAWLKRVVIGNNYGTWQANSFSCKARLESFVISADIGLTSLIAGAIYGCRSLRGIVLPTGITTITTTSIAACSDLKYIAFPNTLSSIGGNEALTMNGLKILTIPDGMTTIGGNMCARCTGLEIVTLPNGLTAVPAGFVFCVSLQRIDIPEGVTSIANYAFQSCASLKEVVIPSTMQTIGMGAFSELRNVRRIIIKATTPPTLSNSNAFSTYPSNAKMIVPVGTLETYQAETNWSTYASIMEEASE